MSDHPKKFKAIHASDVTDHALLPELLRRLITQTENDHKLTMLRFDTLEQKLTKMMSHYDDRIADHERRIQALEKARKSK